MDTPKTFFVSNFKFLRNRKKLTQEQLAAHLGFTRKKLEALEGGRVKAPGPEDLLKYSHFFKISLDTLVRVDLTKLGELKLRDLEAGNDVYLKGGQLRVLAITVDKANKENIEYVPIKAKAGYLAGYSDPEFLKELPKFNLPNVSGGGTYRLFPISGDSMLPIPSGSDVLGKYVADWSSIKPRTACIVVLNGNADFVFKMITLVGQEVLLESLNTKYKPYKVNIGEVLEIWQYDRYISKQLPQPTPELEHIYGSLKEILSEINSLKNG
jgi:transcriptional regulator with XRE-family HTH domain